MKFKTTLLAALLLSATSAQAALVETDWKTEGDALATLDTETGIEWLDLSLTTSTSLSEMAAQLDSTYAGWRFPTKSEVNELASRLFPLVQFAHNGSTEYFEPDDHPDDSDRFLSLFGTNYTGTSMFGLYHAGSLDNHADDLLFGLYRASSGYNECTICSPKHAQNGVFLVSDGGTTRSSQLNPSINANNANAPATANVSAPAALGLVGLGLFGFAARRRASAATLNK